MKNVKRILTLALALMMVLSLAVSASATADVNALKTETISVSDSDTHTYAVYQIFTGKLSGNTVSDAVLGKNAKLPEGTTLKNALDALEALAADADATENDILDEVSKYVNLSGTAYGSVSAGKPLDVEPGYYLMKDTTSPLPNEESYNLYVVKVAGDVTVAIKRGEVTSEKKVLDINDSTGDVTEEQDSADYDIGDAVPFVLSATITERYDDFKTYYLCFHDTCAEGLDFLSDTVEVFVDGVKITSGYEVKLGGGYTFNVEFEELKDVTAVRANSVITVTYKAILNENAALGAEGNSNTLKVQYSTDPNYVAEGTPDGETPPSPPTGYTPEDKVIVFTYAVNVNKVDEDGAALSGAEFTLYKKLKNEPAADSGVEYVTETENNVVTYWQVLDSAPAGDSKTTFLWKGVDDGEYKLVETQTPPGYNTIDPIAFTIEATHDDEDANPQLTSLEGGIFTATQEGTPAEFTGVLTADVENLPGAVLPETGGMGTTIFYAIGGVLVLAAIVLLVSKKRMASAE